MRPICRPTEFPPQLLRRREPSDHLIDVMALDALVDCEEAYAERLKSLEESLDVNSWQRRGFNTRHNSRPFRRGVFTAPVARSRLRHATGRAPVDPNDTKDLVPTAPILLNLCEGLIGEPGA